MRETLAAAAPDAMTWAAVKPALREAGPYVPGPSLDELMAQHGLHDVAKLNWNEGLWGPLPGVEAAVAAAFGQVWAYPEFAYNELREAIAAETGARPDQVLPGHGIQALILTLIAAFVGPGDAVVVPSPTYGLYAQASRVAGARVETVAAPDLRIDLEAMAAAARRTDARIAWVCDPNNPTGARLDPGEWQAFLDALPPGCLAVADEAYTDYIPPAERPRREDDIDAGRRVVVLRTFSQDLRPRRPAARLPARRPGAAALPPARCRSRSTSTARRSRPVWPASAARPTSRRGATPQSPRATRLAAALTAGGMRPLPSAGNFLLVDLGVDDAALTDRLLARGVLIRPGGELGLPGFARITVAPQPVMDRAAAALLAVREELV